MKQALVFRTGETTCREKPVETGCMCKFVRTKNFGQTFVCALYEQVLHHDDDGWLQRLPQCMRDHRGVLDDGHEHG